MSATDTPPRSRPPRRTRPAGVDRLAALLLAIEAVRRGGTISLSGVYGGMLDLLPLLNDDDVLGVDDFATHRLPLDDAALAYAQFQKKADATIKVLFQPSR